MTGDYYSYMIKISNGGEHKDCLVERAYWAYTTAYKAKHELGPLNPLRLGLALKFSAFHFEVKKNTPRVSAELGR